MLCCVVVLTFRAEQGSELALGASAIETSDEEHDFTEVQMVAAAAAEANGLAHEGRQRLTSLQKLQEEVAERAACTRRALYMLS